MTVADTQHSADFSGSFQDLGKPYLTDVSQRATGQDFAFLAIDRTRSTLDALRSVRRVLKDGQRVDGLLPEPQVELGYLNSIRFNAFCHARPDIDAFHLGMPIIVPYCMIDFCGHFFCRTDFYPDIGNPKPKIDQSANIMLRSAIEESGQDAYPGAIIKALGMSSQPLELKHFEVLANACLPDDITRRSAAIYFAHQLTYFIWLHELAHMSHGHIEKLRLRNGCAFRLCEIEETGPPDLDQREPSNLSQLCEIDADSRAARLVVAQMLLGDDPLYGPKNSFNASVETRVEIFLYLVTMFHITQWFEQKTEDESDSPSSHPPSLIRAACCLMQVNLLSGFNPEVGDALHSALANLLGWEEEYVSTFLFNDIKHLGGNRIYELCDDWIDAVNEKVRTNEAGYFGFGWLEMGLDPSLRT